MTRLRLTQAQTIALVAEHTVMRNRADAALVSGHVLADVAGEVAAQCVYVSAVRPLVMVRVVDAAVALSIHSRTPGMEH